MNKIIEQPNNICAIDASTNSLAFSFYSFKSLQKFGKIAFEGGNIYEKVADASRKTKALFDLYNMVDAVVIEQSVFINSPKTLIDLSMIQGAILSGAAVTGIDNFYTVPPITWQNYLGNKKLTKEEQFKIKTQNPGKSLSWYKSYERNIRKERTIKLIEIAYNKKVPDNDVADACGIGHYAINNWEKIAGI